MVLSRLSGTQSIQIMKKENKQRKPSRQPRSRLGMQVLFCRFQETRVWWHLASSSLTSIMLPQYSLGLWLRCIGNSRMKNRQRKWQLPDSIIFCWQKTISNLWEKILCRQYLNKLTRSQFKSNIWGLWSRYASTTIQKSCLTFLLRSSPICHNKHQNRYMQDCKDYML